MNQQNSQINRRNFLRLTSLTGAGLVMGLGVKADGLSVIENLGTSNASFELSPLVMIDQTGLVTIFNTKPEIGQGTYQSIPALIAEELEVAMDKIVIKQTGGEKKYGPAQFVGGSSSVRTNYTNLRKVGAAAKEMLVKAASATWNVPVSECYAENATVIHRPTGKKLGYGELAEAASKLEAPKNPTLKDSKDFKILGKSAPRPDIPMKVNGTAKFGIDASVPGMLYASIERCKVFGSKLVSFDATAAKKVKGVIAVETCERIHGIYKSEGVAVIAENYWAAVQGRKALVIKWDYQGNETFNSKDYEQSLRDAAKKEGAVEHQQGNFDKAFAEAPTQLTAFYETPVVSHSPIEPMNCLASWQEGNKLEIWTSTQVPGSVMNDFSRIYGVKQEDLKLNVLFNGGGFGRRLYPDYIHEAVQLSKKVGKPVKSIWSREDDTQQGPFRPLDFFCNERGFRCKWQSHCIST
jgi:isoquinoline 1-oxidoreductase beta subunit